MPSPSCAAARPWRQLDPSHSHGRRTDPAHGRRDRDPAGAGQTSATGTRLNVGALTCARADGGMALQEATFFVRAGEIYGIAGVSGNGQAELAETLMGAREPTSGEIWVEELGDISRTPMSHTRIAAVARDPRRSLRLCAGRHPFTRRQFRGRRPSAPAVMARSGLLDRACHATRRRRGRSPTTMSRACAASSKRRRCYRAATPKSW